MLLKALYDYAQNRRLLDNLPLQRREIHALIDIDCSGKLRSAQLIRLTETDAKGKERLGAERMMPRFPGENNGGKAYFLAESATAVLGRDKTDASPVYADATTAPAKQRNNAKAFSHFWQQVAEAHAATADPRLKALLDFQNTYLCRHGATIEADLPFLGSRLDSKGKSQLIASIGNNDEVPLKAVTLGFSVDGTPLTLDDPSDPLREYWFRAYTRAAFAADQGAQSQAIGESSVCLVTGQTGLPIARSHKPKILGVPGLSSGGYVVSFAKEAPAFSSYGFEMGLNAPISEKAAAAYALAINELLGSDRTSMNLGPVAVCFWCKDSPVVAGKVRSLLAQAHPEQAREFLRAPLGGVCDREVLRRERLYTLALAGNAGRVIVQHWLDETLDKATDNLKRWWRDLKIAPVYARTKPDKQPADADASKAPPSAFALPNLARSMVRRSKGQKDDRLVANRIIQLWRAALEGTTPPLTLLKPILDEFESALLKDDESDSRKRTYPFSTSRFALIKLILIRNRNPGKEGAFMPQPTLADTSDAAYNLGRLLAVLENLQKQYIGKETKGAGIVDRYYGRASSAPASAFPILCHLARSHLAKLRKEKPKIAGGIEKRIAAIMAQFTPQRAGEPPQFPRQLTLEEQGRFALGFYQQKAYRHPPKKPAESPNPTEPAPAAV